MFLKRIYILYLILAILIPAAILVYDSSVLLNLSDTYFVVVPTIAALLIFLLFFLYAVNYFLMRKYISSIFGLINLIFLTLPLLYFFIKQSPSFDYTVISNGVQILTLLTLLMFLAAIFMFPISLTAKWWKTHRAGY